MKYKFESGILTPGKENIEKANILANSTTGSHPLKQTLLPYYIQDGNN